MACRPGDVSNTLTIAKLQFYILRHLGENSRLIVVKNAGHAANLEKSKEVCKSIIDFFQEPAPSASIEGKVGISCDASNL